MNPSADIWPFNPHETSSAFFGTASQCSQAMAQQQAAAMRNALPSLRGIQNAYRPTVEQRDRWMRQELGIPDVSEDVQ